jgi:nitrous oxidase accessory protein NosD
VNGLPVSIIRQNHIGMLNPNNSPAPNQNTFSRCSAAGFFASGALRNKVTNCTFIGNNYGLMIDQTKVQQQVVKNLFLNNRIAVFLRNISGNNQHEVSDNRMETSQPNSKGIYAINVAPPANGFLLIKGNRIQNATQGIHLLNTKGANIA